MVEEGEPGGDILRDRTVSPSELVFRDINAAASAAKAAYLRPTTRKDGSKREDPKRAVIFFEIPANWSGISDGQVPDPSRRTEAGPVWCLIMMPIWLSRIHKQASSFSSCH